MGSRRGDELIPAVVVLTGGIGTGKSTVARLLAARGADVIEADRLGHAVLEPGGAAFGPVAERWPSVVVDGRIDRGALGRIVFAEPGALSELEAMTHPEISRLIHRRIDDSDASVVVVEIPIPARWLDPAWPRVVVDVDDLARRSRLAGRGMEAADIEARMAAQPSRAEWRALADEVVANDGDLTDLEAAVDHLWSRLGESPEGASPPG